MIDHVYVKRMQSRPIYILSWPLVHWMQNTISKETIPICNMSQKLIAFPSGSSIENLCLGRLMASPLRSHFRSLLTPMKQGIGGQVLDLGGIEWKSVINFISCQIKVHYDTLLRTRRHLMSLFRDDTVVLFSTLKHCCQKLGSQSHLWQVCLQVAGQDLAPQVGAWQAAPQGGRAEQGERQEPRCSDQRQLFAFEQLFWLHLFRGGQHLNGEHLSWELLTCWGGCAILFFHADPGFQG